MQTASTKLIKIKVFAFIQARYNSTRFPGKVLKFLKNKCLLEWCVERAKKMKHIEDVVVLTGDDPRNKRIVEWCQDRNIKHFRESEDDVLHRFSEAANHFKADHVIRLTADNPLFDHELAGVLLEQHLARGAAYSSSKSEVESGYPHGIGSEIFSKSALNSIDGLKLDEYDREHVNEYILRNKGIFNTFYLKNRSINPNINFSIDTEQDMLNVSSMLNQFPNNFGSSDFWLNFGHEK